MTLIQYEGLTSAALGAIGTLILFFSSYTFQATEGGVFGSSEITEYNKSIKAKNAKRLYWQRIGLGFLCASFAIQGLSVLG